MKTAIFVEGQTELIFVREYLLKIFEYQNIGIECYTLFRDDSLNYAAFSYPESAEYRSLAENFYQIINVGNDNAVVTQILNREKYLWNAGFSRIIGLRDMYSKAYRELNKESGKIDPDLNEAFKSAVKKEILKRSNKPNQIHFTFAIMEGESWILGFHNCFEKIHPLLTTDYIKQCLGFDLEEIDPETTFFHPAKVLEQIYALANEKYNKSRGNIESIMNSLQKEDFEKLTTGAKCSSFGTFANAVR